MFSRREFMQSMLHVSAGLVAGVKPQLAAHYDLVVSISERELQKAISPIQCSQAAVRTFGGRTALTVAVTIDEAKAWEAVRVTDQYGRRWFIEGQGEALVAPWGERFSLEREQ